MWTYNSDVNSASRENRKEPSSLTLLTEALVNSDSTEDTLNVNKTC